MLGPSSWPQINVKFISKFLNITNFEEDEIVNAPGNDGSESMPELVKRPNPWRKIIIIIMFSFGYFPGVWGLKADVSEPSIGSIFLGRLRKNFSN